MEKNTGKGYWETGKLPEIDYMKDSLFLILDSDAYLASKQNGTSSLEQSLGKNEGQGGNQASAKAPKKICCPCQWDGEGRLKHL